jgi:hypothetical protein
VRTKIGIVYDTATGQIRRYIIPDEDHQLAAHANVSVGEAFITAHHPDPPTLESVKAIVQLRTGKMLT